MVIDGGLEFERPLVELERRIEELRSFTSGQQLNLDQELVQMEERARKLREEIYSNLSPWQIVQVSRHPQRPHTLDYIQGIFTDFQELHGDRAFIDDRAMIGGMAWLNGRPCVVIGTQKGKDTKENLTYNFGLPLPEGYRKALRLMKLAEKFHVPVITFIDTAGAFPGMEGEERGVAESIARNLREMSVLRTPILVVVIGEGGSGGALGIGVGDYVLMLSNAMYTVITPEGCAAILWKDRSAAPRAAEILKLTAPHLKGLGVIDEIIEEPVGGAHREPKVVMERVKAKLSEQFQRLTLLSADNLLEMRYAKYRRMGFLQDAEPLFDAAAGSNGDGPSAAPGQEQNPAPNHAKS